VRLLHELAKIHASFDDPNLVSRAGLVPVMALAQRAGLGELVDEHVRPGRACGVNAHLKVGCLVAGMIGGADSIDDMGLLRHGAMPALFGGIRAPSTLGSFLRSFTWGNVLQLEKVSRLLLGELAHRVPLLPGADVLAFLDIDSMQKRVYGRQKQGAAFGHTKIQGKSLLVRGLNALAATISTPLAAPVIAATRLRGGNEGRGGPACRGLRCESFYLSRAHRRVSGGLTLVPAPPCGRSARSATGSDPQPGAASRAACSSRWAPAGRRAAGAPRRPRPCRLRAFSEMGRCCQRDEPFRLRGVVSCRRHGEDESAFAQADLLGSCGTASIGTWLWKPLSRR
jgi:hypothetical protein